MIPVPQGEVGMKHPIIAEERQEAFRTHYNYVRSLRSLIAGSTLSYTNIGQIELGKTPHLDSKTNLIELTKRSLTDEANIVQVDKDYSYACASWLPVKAYYLLFNVMLTIQYLFTLDRQSFKLGHGKCSQSFTHKLAAKDIVFSTPGLNKVYDKTIFTYHEAPGANLRPALMADQHTKLAMKKIARYKLEDWKRYKNISTFQTRKNRELREAYLQRFQLSIFEFHYHMRLRANYHDFVFIEGVSSTETANYFNEYFAFTKHFYNALLGLKRQLVKARNG
jgi:hypothetical protein